jgi:hypothetical protein
MRVASSPKRAVSHFRSGNRSLALGLRTKTGPVGEPSRVRIASISAAVGAKAGAPGATSIESDRAALSTSALPPGR